MRRRKQARTEEEEEEATAEASTSSATRRRKRSSKLLANSNNNDRLAPFIPYPPTSVRQRIDRAFSHRLYLIDRILIDSFCQFSVLGATGNVYTVSLQLQPSCTCPDFSRGHTCKHILFVMLRVLKLPPNDPRIWQKALLPSELAQLLQESSINESVLASQQVRQRFKQITGEDQNPQTVTQKVVEGDCPICYEEMAGTDEKQLEAVVFCKACGNNVHADCFKRWSQSKGRGKVTCIYCRALWVDETLGKKSGKSTHEGAYINLASYSDAHQSEDISLQALYPDSYQWIRRR